MNINKELYQSEKMANLFINASVFIGDNIYFTAANSCNLFKYSFTSKQISIACKLDINPGNINKFSMLASYLDDIWMIPLDDHYIYKYDTLSGKIKKFHLPSGTKYHSQGMVFRQGTIYDNYIWALPYNGEYILQIDMKSSTIDVLDSWPEDTIFSKKGPNFRSVSFYKGNLYLFSDECNNNMVIDVRNKSIKKWVTPFRGKYGAVNNDLVVISPVKIEDGIHVYDLNGKEIQSFLVNVESQIRSESDGYDYWFVKAVGKCFFILPHRRSNIIVIKDNRMNTIRLKNDLYDSVSGNENYAIYDAIGHRGNVYLISDAGNQIFVIDDTLNIKEIIELRVPQSWISYRLQEYVRWIESEDLAHINISEVIREEPLGYL